MRADRQLVTTALVFLFFAEGQRAFFASLFGLAYDAVFPELLPGAALLATVPLLALLAPVLPLARLADRTAAVAIATVGIAVFRVPLIFPDFALRATFAALVVACGALFLTWAVGHYDGRSVAAGAIAGLVVDQLLRLAGTSWDLSLRPGWLPVQAVLSLILVLLVLAPDREEAMATRPPTGGSPLERRSGGLRLRGALALGALLFLDLHLLGIPPVIARWTGASYEMAALAVAGAGGLALGVALVDRGPIRDRRLAMALVLLLGAALAAGPYLGGAPGAVLLAGGHGAALLLLARALNPASGRRGPIVVTAGMWMFAGLTALYAATFFHGYLFPILRGAAPWIIGAAVVFIGAAFLLLPQPPATPRRLPLRWAAGSALGVVAIATLLVLWVHAPAPAPVPTGVAAVSRGPGAPGVPVRVATYNIHFGFDEGWRYDPAAIADVIAAASPDIVALQEVAVGMPTAYGVDLPLWLARRLGIPSFFSPNENRLQGEALLARVPTRGVRAIPLPPFPPEAGDRKHLLHLSAILGGRSVDVYALHLSVHEEERSAQVQTSLDYIAPGRAILLGDLNAEPGGHVVTTLRAAGFSDAFEAAGADTTLASAGTWPASRPEMRIDWVWLRGIGAVDARVLEADPSDHRLVAATLQVDPPNP